MIGLWGNRVIQNLLKYFLFSKYTILIIFQIFVWSLQSAAVLLCIFVCGRPLKKIGYQGKFAYDLADNDPSTPVRRATISSPLGSSSMDDVNKGDDVEIKQERMDTSSSHGEDSPLVDNKHPAKKLRTQVADAESNTMNTGEFVWHIPPKSLSIKNARGKSLFD